MTAFNRLGGQGGAGQAQGRSRHTLGATAGMRSRNGGGLDQSSGM